MIKCERTMLGGAGKRKWASCDTIQRRGKEGGAKKSLGRRIARRVDRDGSGRPWGFNDFARFGPAPVPRGSSARPANGCADRLEEKMEPNPICSGFRMAQAPISNRPLGFSWSGCSTWRGVPKSDRGVGSELAVVRSELSFEERRLKIRIFSSVVLSVLCLHTCTSEF